MKLRSRYGLYYLLLIALFVAVSCTHEPWFDEAQAWQIAKCATIHDILFVIPHYEGHPPLWHLLLAIPAKLCFPFEVGLKCIGTICFTGSIYLILFKSSFPKLAKILLPASYFVFYQYGIVVRPYCLMILTSLLLGMSFGERNRRPLVFVGLLILLCLESALGMLFAAAVAICYSYDIIQEKSFKVFIREIPYDHRTQSLLILLLVGIITTLEIIPKSDTLITSSVRYNSFLKCFITAFFTFIGECILTEASWLHNESVLFQQVPIPVSELIIFIILGIVIWFIVVAISSKRLLKYLIVPYLFFTLFSSAVYMNTHHVGFVVIIGLFWTWIVFDDPNRFEIGLIALDRITSTERDSLLARKAVIVIGALCLVVPCYWTVSACLIDLNSEYSYGRGTASFLSNNDLLEYEIFSAPGNEASTVFEDATLFVSAPTEIAAYFNRNIIYNFNLGDDKQAFFWHRISSKNEIDDTIQNWRKCGMPDVIIGYNDLSYVFGDNFTYKDYSLVYVNKSKVIWKNSYNLIKLPVYVRNELVEKLGINPLPDYNYNEEGSFTLTDEMINQYKYGVPIEVILKPYLDEMFEI